MCLLGSEQVGDDGVGEEAAAGGEGDGVARLLEEAGGEVAVEGGAAIGVEVLVDPIEPDAFSEAELHHEVFADAGAVVELFDVLDGSGSGGVEVLAEVGDVSPAEAVDVSGGGGTEGEPVLVAPVDEVVLTAAVGGAGEV